MFATSLVDSSVALVSVEDVLISPILEKSIDTEIDGPRELCYKTEWEPALLLQPTETATLLLQPSETATNGASPAQFGAEIVIIHGDSEAQTSMAASLADALAGLTGARPSTGLLSVIAAEAKDKLCIFLAELSQPILANIDVTEFEALQCLLTTVQGLLWVVQGAYVGSSNPDANMIAGLSRTLRSEGTLMKFITLDLDARTETSGSMALQILLDVCVATLATSSKIEETEFMERDGKLFTPRIINDEAMNEFVDNKINPPTLEPASFSALDRPLKATVSTPGVLEDVHFEDDKITECPLPADHVAFQVKAVGLSPRGGPADFGVDMEPSGIVTAVGADVPNIQVGDRVTAFAPNGSLSTVDRAHFRSLFKLPDHISFESAATLPKAYCAASYALIDQARLAEGETVLIHDAASAIGQAGLAIARMVGADAWTTVKSAEEKELLMREFNILEAGIWYAGSETFAESITTATGGKGVDVVFNTLTESHLLPATWQCLSNFGRFVNVGAGHVTLGDMPIDKNATVLSADVAALSTHRPQIVDRTLSDVAKLLRYGKIQPICDVKTYRVSELAAAFQSLRTGDNRKVVVVPQDDDMVMVSDSSIE
jgi:NADPH:quinone reductase-like Zn-dependent oxidoreductase